MATWHYYNEKGEKITVTGGQLKGLAKAGRITPETIVETEEGKQVPARKVKGLAFAGAVQSEPAPVAVRKNFYYTDANGLKQGLVNEVQLKELAAQGIITPDTLLEAEAGQKGKAGQIRGLFPTAPSPFTQAIPPKVSAPVAVDTTDVNEDENGFDYRRIASLHRLSTWSILVFVLIAQTTRILRDGSMFGEVTFGLMALVAVCFSSVCVVMLARSIQYSVLATVIFTMCIFPLSLLGILISPLAIILIMLVPFFGVYACAIKMLKKAGYKIGFVGADMRQLGANPRIPEGVNTLVACLVVIAIVFLAWNAGQQRTTNRSEWQANRTGTDTSSKTYRDNEYRFSFDYPEGWEGIVRPANKPAMLVVVPCPTDGNSLVAVLTNDFPPGVDVSNEDLLKVSKAAFQNTLERGFNNVQIKDFGIKEIGGKECLFCHFQAMERTDNIPIEILHFSVIRNGKELIIRAIDRQANFSKNRPAFDSIISSFRFDPSVPSTSTVAEQIDVSEKDEDGDTQLHIAALMGHLEDARRLVTRGADVHAKNNDGDSPLHYAAMGGNIDVVNLLVSEKANVNAKNNDSFTPLHKAVMAGNVECVKFLVSKGANVNARINIDDEYGELSGAFPLHFAAHMGNVEIVRFLVDKGANVSARTFVDWTVIHCAARDGNVEVAKIFVGKGVTVNAKDKDNDTPLHVAAYWGHIEFVKYLISQGANVNAKNNDDLTPLDAAKAGGHTAIVRYLTGL